MEINLFIKGEYDSPNVKKFDIKVEHGFALSIGELPDDNDGFFTDDYSLDVTMLDDAYLM